ncbi:hypothetical protein GALL_35430 [mine drainage metagenome]|uniref:Outer membrane protein beta-barrel domain-containing protein n=1 Tax=mine drainage metagenome TaxID=410659 RepID=A0A1J5T5B3_9ZZZZ
MKKNLVVSVALAGALLAAASAHAEVRHVADTNEVAGTVDVNNSTIGASLGHWFSDNIGASIGLSNGNSFTTTEIRGTYLIDKPFDIARYPALPYVGAGFISISGPTYSFGGASAQSKGSGLEIFGGVQWQTPWVKNLLFRAEARFSTATVDTTVNFGGGAYRYDAGYNNVSALASAVYQF